MSNKILELYNEFKDEKYTTLVIRNGHLYERVYNTYDKPDYTLLLTNLNEAEIAYAKTLGIYGKFEFNQK